MDGEDKTYEFWTNTSPSPHPLLASCRVQWLIRTWRSRDLAGAGIRVQLPEPFHGRSKEKDSKRGSNRNLDPSSSTSRDRQCSFLPDELGGRECPFPSQILRSFFDPFILHILGWDSFIYNSNNQSFTKSDWTPPTETEGSTAGRDPGTASSSTFKEEKKSGESGCLHPWTA